jgi:3,8-divinyl chlorophyllide a/chlorophyllide a reductase subunit Y
MTQASPKPAEAAESRRERAGFGLPRRRGGDAEGGPRRRQVGTLERYAADYPKGPHDQPQSMCPAFGSLRVGLRMRRTATILSGRPAACMASRSHRTSMAPSAASAMCRSIPRRSSPASSSRTFARPSSRWPTRRSTTRSSSRTSACRRRRACRLQLLPKEINGVRVIGIDVPGFGVPTHAEAKDVLAGAMLNYARLEAEQGPVASAARRTQRQADDHPARRNLPRRSR